MRWMQGLLLVGAAACLPAAAQAPGAAPSTDTTRQFEAGRSADFRNWVWRAQRGVQSSDAERAVDAVLDAVAQRDCAAAVTRLNAGLAKAHPEVLALAGAMYEQGLCLKPNWERALGLYQRAETAGHPGAAARVAAGYASAAGGRDMATALWWAIRAKTALPAVCAQVAPLAGDVDRFVAALNAWPADQLNACAYCAAVMATIQAEAVSPALATAFGLQGRIKISFAPEPGRVDITEALSDATPVQGAVIDAAARESNSRAARHALSAHLRQVADRALARYDKPAAVPPGWRSEAEFVLGGAR